MSEEPATYGHRDTLVARNALEDTIRAEYSPEDVHRLGGVVAFAKSRGISTEELFSVLCRVSPGLSAIPDQTDKSAPASSGTVVRGNFGKTITVELTDQQKAVVAAVLQGVKGGVDEQTIGGYAGSGKSVLVKHLRAQLKGWAVCAYTGKAAHVLRQKGVDASTIHNLIYEPQEIGGKVHFRRRGAIDCPGVIVDESSMVPRSIHADLQGYKVPLVFVGDHGQLEPVDGGDGPPFNLMESPDYELTEIHRNAGPIARFAELLRNGEDVDGSEESDEVEFARMNLLKKSTVLSADQVIVPFNKMRAQYNRTIRDGLGRNPGRLDLGDRVVCLRNNHDLGLFNGMQGVVESLYEDPEGRTDRCLMDFCSDDGRPFTEISVDATQFGKERYDFSRKRGTPEPFDYAYAITCHRAQGSEWDTVLVAAKPCSAWSWERWAYTAASRARKKLIWAT